MTPNRSLFKTFAALLAAVSVAAFAAPACAKTVDLVCSWDNGVGEDTHLSIDLDASSVSDGSASYKATITATTYQWDTGAAEADWRTHYLIDRSTGKIIINPLFRGAAIGGSGAATTGKCRIDVPRL